METTLTERGQTSVPASLRKKYGLGPHARLVWIDTGTGIHVVPMPKDPIKGFRGLFKGLDLVEDLLKDRQQERRRERSQERH